MTSTYRMNAAAKAYTLRLIENQDCSKIGHTNGLFAFIGRSLLSSFFFIVMSYVFFSVVVRMGLFYSMPCALALAIFTHALYTYVRICDKIKLYLFTSGKSRHTIANHNKCTISNSEIEGFDVRIKARKVIVKLMVFSLSLLSRPTI